MNDKSFLSIDEFNLDKEWIKQPQLYYEWAKKAADARKDFETAKNQQEVVKSEISLEVRSDPMSFGIEGKLTEKIVDAAIIDDVRFVRVLRKVNDARHKHEIASAVVSALDNRRTALGKLVDLHLASYYAEPRTKVNREQVEEMKKDMAFKSKGRRGRQRDDDV